VSLSFVVRQAALAPELHASDVRVLVAVSEYLDYVEPRPLKVYFVAHVLGIAESTASGALRRLATHGFLAREAPAGSGSAVSYRLLPSRRPACPQ
jgi:predicted transcriptional regulator